MWGRFEAKCGNLVVVVQRQCIFNFTSFSISCCQVQSCNMLPARCSVRSNMRARRALGTSAKQWHSCCCSIASHTPAFVCREPSSFFRFAETDLGKETRTSSCTETSDGRDTLIESQRHRLSPVLVFISHCVRNLFV